MTMIYLDNGATTPPDPDILDGMAAIEVEHFGNTSSSHRLGLEAQQALDDARARVAQAFGGRARNVIFTGGGTEAITLAILGSAGPRPGRIAISAVEHSAVKEAAKWLHENRAWSVDVVPVNAFGQVDTETLRAHVSKDTRIVATMMVNNEIGAINPIQAIGQVVKQRAPRAKLIVDAVQAFGKVPFNVADLGADCVAVAAHKLHGPKGCGALWSRHALTPMAKGGGQEFGQRGGTPSLSNAWALGEAYERQWAAREQILSLRDHLWALLLDALPDIELTGPPFDSGRVCNNIHICIPGLPTEPVLNALSAEGVFVSGGSACSAGRFSSVLEALGRRPQEGAFIRLTVGRFNVPAELPNAVDKIREVVADLRRVYG
ncbi:MAG: cysteine desulfurase family protein [Bradymonadia bacterium]